MAFCGSEVFDEKKEDVAEMDHSLKNVVAFSTCKKQVCSPSKEGLLESDPKKKGEFRDRRIKIDYGKPIYFCNSLMSSQVKVKLLSGKSAVGSGSLIQVHGVDHLLTCAHNLCTMSSYHKRLVRHEDGYVYEVRYGEDKWWGLHKLDGEGVKLHPNYNDDPSCGFDIAVAPLAKMNHINNETVSLKGLVKDSIWQCAVPKSLKAGMKVEICGYPGEMKGFPYYHFGEIKDVKKQARGGWTIYYNLDSSPGMSGSAIRIVEEEWLKEHVAEIARINGAKKVIIGVHTGHDDTVMLNYGTLITPSLRQWIEPKKKSLLGRFFGRS